MSPTLTSSLPALQDLKLVGKTHVNTVDGRNPFRTTLKPAESVTLAGILTGVPNHSKASQVVQDFVHP